MQLKDNVSVISADGKDLGHVKRVVLDPLTDEVKDLVIRQGTLLTEDRVVPADNVGETGGEQVKLNLVAAEFEKLPLFEDTRYVSASGDVSLTPPAAPAYYLYPPLGGFGPGLYEGTYTPEMAGYAVRRERNIPENAVPLKAGASVKGRDDHEVGRLEQVLTAPGSDHVTHIIVSSGVLHKSRHIIPLAWVQDIGETEVRLGVPAQVVEHLPEYEH